jgi:hypothetical protein
MTATPVTRLDHSTCDHPRTKAGRAACRKAMREAESTPQHQAASRAKGK